MAKKLVEEWCKVIGLPRNQGLVTLFEAGNEVMSQMIKMGKIIGAKVWTTPMPA